MAASIERTVGTLEGAVAVLVAAGWTRDEIVAHVDYALGEVNLVKRDESSGRWYVLDANGDRKHGPYMDERQARRAAV